MKTRTIFFALLIMVPALSYGQIGNFLKNKASKAIGNVTKATTQQVGSTIDSTAQTKTQKIVSSADSIHQNASNKVNQAAGQGTQGQGGLNFGKFLGGKVDLKYNDEYDFTSRLYMQTESYNKKDVMKMDLFLYFSASSPSVGMETKSVTNQQGTANQVASSMVMDGENKCFIILTDVGATKMGIISAIPDENTAQTQPDGTPAKKATPTNFTKTGNTRIIAGYKCDEYIYKDAENKSSGKVWFTKDANLKIDKRGWQKTGMGAYYGYAGFEGGIILANEAYDADGKLTMKSETKEINPNYSHSITVKGYTLRQMNINQNQPKK